MGIFTSKPAREPTPNLQFTRVKVVRELADRGRRIIAGDAVRASEREARESPQRPWCGAKGRHR